MHFYYRIFFKHCGGTSHPNIRPKSSRINKPSVEKKMMLSRTWKRTGNVLLRKWETVLRFVIRFLDFRVKDSKRWNKTYQRLEYRLIRDWFGWLMRALLSAQSTRSSHLMFQSTETNKKLNYKWRIVQHSISQPGFGSYNTTFLWLA